MNSHNIYWDTLSSPNTSWELFVDKPFCLPATSILEHLQDGIIFRSCKASLKNDSLRIICLKFAEKIWSTHGHFSLSYKTSWFRQKTFELWPPHIFRVISWTPYGRELNVGTVHYSLKKKLLCSTFRPKTFTPSICKTKHSSSSRIHRLIAFIKAWCTMACIAL